MEISMSSPRRRVDSGEDYCRIPSGDGKHSLSQLAHEIGIGLGSVGQETGLETFSFGLVDLGLFLRLELGLFDHTAKEM